MIDSVEQAETADSMSAQCADLIGGLSRVFFSHFDRDVARAKAICATCGIRRSCLDGAIERAEPHGIWGGQIVRNGVAIEMWPRRGRPRKMER